jgi:hypothetical protein
MKLKKMWLKTPVSEEQAAQAVLDPAIGNYQIIRILIKWFIHCGRHSTTHEHGRRMSRKAKVRRGTRIAMMCMHRRAFRRRDGIHCHLPIIPTSPQSVVLLSRFLLREIMLFAVSMKFLALFLTEKMKLDEETLNT